MLHLLGGDPDVLTKYSKPDVKAEKKHPLVQFDGVSEEDFTNWGGNVTHKYKGIYYPKNVKEVQAIVKKAAS